MMMGFLMHQDVSRSQRKIYKSGDATNFSYSELRSVFSLLSSF